MENIDDIKYMQAALEQARMALERGEIPIGAVIVAQNRIIARGHNLTQTLMDPTAHAEMQAITAATHALGGKYLSGCTIYVTVEPCPMCASALRWAQVDRVVWGAKDIKRGFTTISDKLLHPKTTTNNGVLELECAELMTNFFAQLRK
ncbi:MAG: nucleoside deaminase [Mucinivorans sp.]